MTGRETTHTTSGRSDAVLWVSYISGTGDRVPVNKPPAVILDFLPVYKQASSIHRMMSEKLHIHAIDKQGRFIYNHDIDEEEAEEDPS